MKDTTTLHSRAFAMYKLFTILLLLNIFILYTGANLYAQQGVVPTMTPEGGFAIDGNLLARSPAVSPFSQDDGDFLPNENAAGNGGYVFDLAGMPMDTLTAFHVIDGFDHDDANIFTDGSKFNMDPANWVWMPGKPPAKDDINHTLFFFSSDTLGNIWFIGAGDRKRAKGNTYLDFELLQNPLYQNSDSTFTSMGPHGGRTIGDLAFTVEFVNGGIVPELYVYKWDSTGQGEYDFVLVSPPDGTTYLSVNADSAVTVPFGAYGKSYYDKNAFTELAININEVVPGDYVCLDIKTVFAKTKASQSINAALKDVTTPRQVDISSAPVISVDDVSICYGDTAMLSVNIISGTGPFTYQWSNGDTTQSIYVSPDTTTQYNVVVTGVNGCPSDTAFATVTVFPLPECSITGTDTLCPLESGQYSAPDSLSTYLWTVYGPAVILGSNSMQMVEVEGTGYCDTTFTIELYVTDSNGCANTCTMTVAMIDTLAPVFSYVPDSLFLECASEVPVASPDSVMVSDNCNGDITVMVSDSVMNDTLCPNQFTLIRTWTAMDTCGNMSMATQYISVFDSIAPTFSYVPDSLFLQCASTVPAASPDSVIVSDNCADDLIVMVSDSVMNDTLCPNQFTLIRTWTAMDTCGNMSMATQYISVFDSIPPVLYGVPADTGVCCADSIPPPANVTAIDSCDGTVDVSLTEIVSDSTSPLYFTLTRIWTAWDTCTNMVSDTMVIEVNDTLYPAGNGLLGIPSGNDIVLYLKATPNPFNNATNIAFSLSQKANVTLDLYNFTGIQLQSLYSGTVAAGGNTIVRLTTDDSMPAGMYLLVLKTPYGITTKRILLSK